jgi:tetratricopeptide (TPR) repeat protein
MKHTTGNEPLEAWKECPHVTWELPGRVFEQGAEMKKALATVLLLVVSAFAFALPTPKEIEAAVKAGHLPQAESMLREVIKEKPASAKARYELGQVLAREGRNAEARSELLEAQRLDSSLKFATDPQRFRDLLNKIPGETSAPALPTGNAARQLTNAPVPGTPSFPLLYVVVGGGLVLLVWVLLRNRSAGQRPPLPAAAPGGTLSGGYGAGYGPAPGPAQNPGSGVGGTLLGGVAGLAAGYGIAKLLEKDGGASSPARESNDSGFIPIDSPSSQPDYGDFDAGTGDSWDSGDSSGGGDDSW